MLLRGRIVGGFVALVGLIFTIVGVGLLATAGWTHTHATVVGQCSTRLSGSGSGRTVQQTCAVTWQDAGVSHTGQLTVSQNTPIYPGSVLDVQAHGDNVAQPSPMWIRVGTLILGLVLVATGLIVIFRAGRTRRVRTASMSPIQPG
jgi:hypothetical protein